MKKIILLLLVIPLFIASEPPSPFKDRVIIEDFPLKPPTVKPTHNPIDGLVDALIYVESRGKDDAVGDTHLESPSIGVLQIRPIMVREVNRILKIQDKKKQFKLKDRFNRQKSIDMFMIWRKFHHSQDGMEKIARCWNGGGRGYKNPRTEKYWVKVQKQLKKPSTSHL